MITVSDNDAANALTSYLGGGEFSRNAGGKQLLQRQRLYEYPHGPSASSEQSV